ncbi:MAG: carbonic anhydrase [Pseudohongiellaceae bacterium]
MEKVVSGIMQFKSSSYEERKTLFAELATGQSPEVLFITCSDSRIDPNMVTQTEPGDLFIIRNAGNIVPPHAKTAGGVTASIEFAVAALGVKHIIVCGHTDCGAMKGALNLAALDGLPHVQEWLDHSRAAVEVVKAKHGQVTIDEISNVTEENVLLQLQHLKTHPAVASKLSTGEVDLHGWVYDIKHGTMSAFDDERECFIPAEERYADLIKEVGEKALKTA